MNKQVKIKNGVIVGRGIEFEWKPIVGYEGLYIVSNFGHINSLPRNTTSGGILFPVLNTSGYFRVNLTKDGKSRYLYIHHLVAKAFIGERPLGMDINHIDGDKLNNEASNLEYCTRTENMAHARRLGLHDNRGEKQWNHKLGENVVLEMRHAYKTCGLRGVDMAEGLGISPRTIDDALDHITWRHLP